MNLQWLANIDKTNMKYFQTYLVDKKLGEPQPNGIYSVDELKEQGKVGVYRDLDKPTVKKRNLWN